MTRKNINDSNSGTVDICSFYAKQSHKFTVHYISVELVIFRPLLRPTSRIHMAA